MQVKCSAGFVLWHRTVLISLMCLGYWQERIYSTRQKDQEKLAEKGAFYVTRRWATCKSPDFLHADSRWICLRCQIKLPATIGTAGKPQVGPKNTRAKGKCSWFFIQISLHEKSGTFTYGPRLFWPHMWFTGGAGNFTCQRRHIYQRSACRTSGDLHVAYLRVT